METSRRAIREAIGGKAFLLSASWEPIPQPCGRHTCCKSPPTSDLGFDAGPPVGVDDPGAWGWRWRMNRDQRLFSEFGCEQALASQRKRGAHNTRRRAGELGIPPAQAIHVPRGQ